MPSIFYAIPIAGVISVVYTATRFEMPSVILQRSAIMFAKTVMGLGILYAVLWYVSS